MTLMRLTRSAMVGMMAAGLAGCVGTMGESSAGSDLRTAIFGNPENRPQEFPTGPTREFTCPSVDIMEGAAAYRIGGAAGVAHQASITDVARECAIEGKQARMKIGIQGRMLLGAAGRPGTYTVPVRIAIKSGEKVVVSRSARVAVTVPANEAGASFTHIEENIILPISERDIADEYDVYAGFDAGGGAADPRRGRRR